MNRCKVDGCNGPTRGYGWCFFHRSNWKKYGTPTPMCVVPGCGRGRKDRPYCYLHQRNLDRYGTLEKPGRLDAAPLFAYVAAHGGVGAVVSAAGYAWGTPAYDSMTKRFERVTAEGNLTPDMADAIAVQLLGVHPCFIWGDAWFLDVLVDLDDQAVAS